MTSLPDDQYRAAIASVTKRGRGLPLAEDERRQLYDWLANGDVDEELLRLVCARIVELEEALTRLGAVASGVAQTLTGHAPPREAREMAADLDRYREKGLDVLPGLRRASE